MMESPAVERYTRALFDLAQKRRELEKIEKDLERADAIVRQYPEISSLLLNSTIAVSEKEDFMNKIFPSDISPLVIQFLKVLVKKHRFQDLSAIQKRFHRAFEQKQNIQEVTAISAVPLSESNREKLRGVLKKTLQSEILLTVKVNADLLGGFVLHFNGTEIDASYRNHLDALRQKLLA
jgi:F-type H+-transporting ATPase subunit delta